MISIGAQQQKAQRAAATFMTPSLTPARAALQLASPCRRRLTTSPSGAVRVANAARAARRSTATRGSRATVLPSGSRATVLPSSSDRPGGGEDHPRRGCQPAALLSAASPQCWLAARGSPLRARLSAPYSTHSFSLRAARTLVGDRVIDDETLQDTCAVPCLSCATAAEERQCLPAAAPRPCPAYAPPTPRHQPARPRWRQQHSQAARLLPQLHRLMLRFRRSCAAGEAVCPGAAPPGLAARPPRGARATRPRLHLL